MEYSRKSHASIVQDYKDGLSLSECAHKHQCSKSKVEYVARKHGVIRKLKKRVIGKVKIKCLHCEVEKDVCHSLRHQKFCSNKCRGRWMALHVKGDKHPSWKGDVITKCETCGQAILDKLCRKRRFCSLECYGEWLSRTNVGERNPFYGKKHTEKSIEKRLKSIEARGGMPSGKDHPFYGIPRPATAQQTVRSHHTNWRGETYHLRSSYEKAYAEYLDSVKVNWDYEARCFPAGDTTYTPDFFIYSDDGQELLRVDEVKGYMRPEAALKIRKFKELYPGIQLNVLFKDDLNQLEGIRLKK